MKIMFASDLHGSSYYVEKLLDAYNKEQPEKLVLLGDLLYHGPRNPLSEKYNTQSVCAMLNSIKDNIISVRGNCDSEVDQMVLEFQITADITTLFVDGFSIFASHGHVYHYDKLPLMNKGDVFIQGHTHIPVLEIKDGITLLNPGSVSLPKGDSTNSYMVYENKTFTLKDLSGNVLKELSV